MPISLESYSTARVNGTRTATEMRFPALAGRQKPFLLAGAAAANMFVALALVRVSPIAGVAIALLPVLVILAPALTTPLSRAILFSAALALGLFAPPLIRSFSVGAANIHTQDIIVGIAIVGWLLSRLLTPASAHVPRTLVLGWPYVLLAATLGIATLRGHYAYGASLLGQPFRLVAYAGIVVTLSGMTSARLLRLVTGVLYSGIAVTMVLATYHVASGTSQAASDSLSTGGFRPLAISTSVLCSSALFLALLRLRYAQTASQKALHATIAVLSLVGVVLGFGRAVLAAVFVVCIGLLLMSARLRRSVVGLIPLAAPILALAGILVALAAPTLVFSFVDRISSPPAQDSNVQWRIEANKAILAQVREQPLYGVGFGRMAEFFIDIESSNGYRVPFREEIGQDPHNGYLFLLAGGGILALTSFLLVLSAYAVDAWRRFIRVREQADRTLLLWSALSLLPVLLNAAAAPTFGKPSEILNLWALLLVPAVVVGRAAVGSSDSHKRLHGT
jgi:hypothetical protein